MNTCSSCGAAFRPQSLAWGTETCGDCIADRIAYALARPMLLADRKPVRRVERTTEADLIVAEAEAKIEAARLRRA
jgi:hypothetical protein